MEKTQPYETFQFIDSNSNQDMNQLLVLQEDGTLLSVNRDIQYITQVQDEKNSIEDSQSCTVFDVSSQQFFVNVDNAQDLIVQEQFEIPDEDRNIYSNSFLIETETDTTASIEQVDTQTSEPAIKPELHTLNDANANGKSVNNFTEITLTDAQYHLLEQKGWILLEFGGRVFVLDTLGLHDITNDEKLIEKLKIELEHTTQEDDQTQTCDIVIENNLKVNVENVVKNEDLADEFQPQMKVDLEDTTIDENLDEITSQQDTEDSEIQRSEHLDTQYNESKDLERKCESIRIKTKYKFQDIPDKIFLGRTVNGKKLYAKITNKKPVKTQEIPANTTNAVLRNDVPFISTLQQHLRSRAAAPAGDALAAAALLRQLLQLPHVISTADTNYVVVTKTIVLASEDGRKKRRRPTTVTGEILYGRFIHTPDLLHNLLNPESKEETSKEFVELIHIDVTETKMPNKPSVPSINVCNRKIYFEVLRDSKKRHPNPVYACGACAAIFKYQNQLKEHMELSENCTGIVDHDDELTIDTDQIQDSYYMLDTGKQKWYSCMQCQAKFLKLSNCKKHVKSHIRPEQDSNTKNSEIKEYKCKMCSSKYFHASSLSKHIVKRHIAGQVIK